MFGKKFKLFKLFGFKVDMDASWFILAVLIIWTLAKGYFPYYYDNFKELTYWWMGLAGAVGLFVSIVFHELSHSLVARRYGLPMKGITLFIFGGVAHMEDEPPSAKSEFLMAIAGPISSFLLAFIFYILYYFGKTVGFYESGNAVFNYLAFINVVLAVFNLIPGFPLDGGRVLRSALWYWKNNLRWATRISSQIGSAFGITFIFLGILTFIFGNFVQGVWWALIGMFLKGASDMSYQQLTIRRALEGESIDRFMKRDPITIPSSISLKELVEGYFYTYHYKMFPVVDNSKLLGCITTKDIKKFEKEKWDQIKASEIVHNCSPENTIDTETDAIKALSIMNKTGNSRLMVVDKGELIGILALKDMMDFLSLKLDLEGN